ncbi:hypothetical protein [Candidatus Symbiobacter mobilis]|uniref:Uncharacterized protein n=1 Tax=Candidatus Symbiobacter mobilis CR TaxID=946483 RepID=U5N830_9BURK|nr:hypothetical protein [Candidatus Symbiobacter mobilis]AGX86423.1 hypothetical protein Cenrod_0299 [Candidatus Symbiobacter mobilis CR]
MKINQLLLTRIAAACFSITAAALLTSGCGGGGGGEPVKNPGTVADGYVSGAVVVLDHNDDGVCDDNDRDSRLGTTTDAQGKFSFPAAFGSHMTCAKGGTDITSGQAFIGELKAPAGASVITPLTTLVQATIDAAPAGSKPTPEAAAQQVATKLGLADLGTQILSTDPVASAATIPALTQTTTAVQVLLVQTARTIAAAAGWNASTDQTAALYRAAIVGLAAAVNTSNPTDLKNLASATALIKTAMNQAVVKAQAEAIIPALANLAPASIAAVASGNIATVTQGVANSTKSLLSALQDTFASQTTALLAPVLTQQVAASGVEGFVDTLSTTATAVAAALQQGNINNAASPIQQLLAKVNAVSEPDITIPLPTGGKVVDGYVEGATVVLDKNDDGVCDDNKTDSNLATTTDAQGNFSFPAAFGSHMTCAKGGTDISTGQAFIGELKAPAGSTQITPLTTLVQATMEAEAGSGVYVKPTSEQIATAAEKIATNLGLDIGAEILTTDPVAAAETNSALTQTTIAVQVMLVQMANTIASAATGQETTTTTATQSAALYQAAVTGLSNAVATVQAPVTLSNSSTTSTTAVRALVTEAVTKSVDAAKESASANTNANIGNLAGLDSASVAAVTANNVAQVTQSIASKPAAVLVQATATQTENQVLQALQDTTALQTTATLANLLTTTVAEKATASNSVTQLQELATAITTAVQTGDVSAAETAIEDHVEAVQEETGTTITVELPPVAPPQNMLVLSEPKVNSVAVDTTKALPYRVTVPGPLTTASLKLTALDQPVFTNPTVKLNVLEYGTGSRQLRLSIAPVTFGLDGNSVTLQVPTTATVSVTGVNSSGQTFTAVLDDIAQQVLVLQNQVLAFNWEPVVAQLSQQTGFGTIGITSGTFSVDAKLEGVSSVARLSSVTGAVPVKLADGTETIIVTIQASTTNP